MKPKFVISRDGVVYCTCHRVLRKSDTVVSDDQALLAQFVIQRNRDICLEGVKVLLRLSESIKWCSS